MMSDEIFLTCLFSLWDNAGDAKSCRATQNKKLMQSFY